MRLSSATHPDLLVLLAVASLQRNVASGAMAPRARESSGRLWPGVTPSAIFRGNLLSPLCFRT